MKRKAFIIFILLIVVLSTLMTGCKKKIEEKIVENIIEESTGGEVDISNDTTTIKTEKGETKVGGDIKWPNGKMGNLPELKANVTMFVEDYDKDRDVTLGMVYFENLKNDDANNYVELIKELKYESVFETSGEDGFIYSGKNVDGSEVVFSWNDDGSGSLSYADNPFMFVDNPYDSDYEDSPSSEEVDMTDEVPWPKEFFNDVPEIEGKITQVNSSSPQDKFVYIEYVTKDTALDYMNKLKDSGFIESPSESQAGDYLYYEATNDKGDYIVFDWSDSEYATINFLKGE